MAVYPIKMLKDEGNNPFVPLVGTNAIVDAQGQSLDDKFATKLEAVNIIAGENITLQKVGNNITINGHAGSSVSLIDNLTTDTPGLGALDARQGKALKDLIPAVINNLNSTSTTSALSAYQGYLLKNRVVPGGGTTGQVLKKSSNADNAVEWGDAADPNAISGDGSIKEIVELTYAEYKALEEINPDTEYHISDLEGGTSTYINEAQIQNMIDDSIPPIVNNLTSTSTTSTLSAAQGKILNDKILGYYPVGSVYMTSTNDSPASYLGGTWTLTGKGFNDSASSSADYITENSTNCTIDGESYCRNGASIELRFHVTTKVAIADSNVELGTIDFSKLGITQISLNLYQHPCLSDGGNGLVSVSISSTTGVVQFNDVIMKDASSSLPAGSAFYVQFTWVEHSNYMLDSACDKFYWERTA